MRNLEIPLEDIIIQPSKYFDTFIQQWESMLKCINEKKRIDNKGFERFNKEKKLLVSKI